MSLKSLPFLLIFPIVLLPYPGKGSFFHKSPADSLPAAFPRFATVQHSLRFPDHLQRELLRADAGWHMPDAGLVKIEAAAAGDRNVLADPGGRFLKLYDFRMRKPYRFVLHEGRYLLQYPATTIMNGQQLFAFQEKEIPVRFVVADESRDPGARMIPVEGNNGKLIFALVLMAVAFLLPPGMFLHPAYKARPKPRERDDLTAGREDAMGKEVLVTQPTNHDKLWNAPSFFKKAKQVASFKD